MDVFIASLQTTCRVINARLSTPEHGILIRYLFHWLPLTVLLLASLAGCGQKGDLYLPDHDTEKSAGS